MATVLIGYDLNKPEQDYAGLIEEIKKLGLWWHCLDSTWLVNTELTTEQVRNRLKTKIDANDELLVIKVKRDAAWTGFNQKCSSWLQENLLDS